MGDTEYPNSPKDVQFVIDNSKGPELGHLSVFMSKNYNDLFFELPGEKERVSAHNCIVSKRCESLTNGSVVKRSRKKKNITTVELKDAIISVECLNRVLHFIYTDSIDLPSFKNEDLLLLNQAARRLNLKRLQWLCEHYLQSTLKMENVFDLLKHAHHLHEADVKAFCLKFALTRYNEFISNKDGVRQLGIDLFQEVVSAEATPGAAKLLNDSAPPPATIVEDFKCVYSEMVDSDAYVKWSTGETIKFHKAVLATHSDVFASVFTAGGTREDYSDHVHGPKGSAAQPGGLDLSCVTPTSFISMLKYIYFKNDEITPIPACELVQFSRKYNLKGLEVLSENIIKKSISVQTVLRILGVTYLPQMEGRKDIQYDLRSQAVAFIVSHLAEVDLSPLRGMEPRVSVDILLACQTNARGEPAWVPAVSSASASSISAAPNKPPPAVPPTGPVAGGASPTTPAASGPSPGIKTQKSKAELRKEEKEKRLLEKKEKEAARKREKASKKTKTPRK